nr:MAG TPA: TMEM9 [Bacteriophage sp.]
MEYLDLLEKTVKHYTLGLSTLILCLLLHLVLYMIYLMKILSILV